LRDWLTEQFTLLGIPFQNWMVVAFAIIVIAVLIAKGEKD
jgi:hypothetical protein